MDKTKRFVNDENAGSNKPVNIETGTVTLNVLRQELDPFIENRVPYVKFAPKLKRFKDRKENLDRHLKEYKAKCLHESTSQVTSEANSDQYAKSGSHQYAENTDQSPKYKSSINKAASFNYLRRTISNLMEAIDNTRFLRRKGKILKASESESTQDSSEDEEYISQTDRFIENSNERLFGIKSKGYKSSKSGVTNIEKTKTKSDVQANLGIQSETQSKYLKYFSKEANPPLSSTQSTSTFPYDSVTRSQYSKVRSTEKESPHFRWPTESNKASLDRIKTKRFKDSKEGGSNAGKTKTKSDMPMKSDAQSATRSKDATLPLFSRQSISAPIRPNFSVIRFQYSNIRSAKEIWEHFKGHLQSNPVSLQRNTIDDIRKGAIFTVSGLEIQNLEDPTKTATKSAGQYLKDPSKTAAEPAGQYLKVPSKTATVAESACQYLKYPTKTATDSVGHYLKEPTKIAKDSSSWYLEDPIKTESKSVSRYLKDPTKAAKETERRILEDPAKSSESASQDFKITSKAVMESTLAQGSGKVMSDVSVARVDNSAAVINNTRSVPRQRIIHDEMDEHYRGWILESIKDKEMLLKTSIMEGKYTEDPETKFNCIDMAEDLLKETDELLNDLDYHDKVLKSPKRCKYNSNQIQKKFSISPTKSENDFIWSKEQIKSFSFLFLQMYKSSSSESESENVLRGMNQRNFISAFETYLESKKEQDHASDELEQAAKRAIRELYLTLVQCRLKVKNEIVHPDNRSLKDFQSYINILKMALNENLNCLKSLPPQENLIFSLFRYLRESRKITGQISSFLLKKRLDVFPNSFDKNKVFFDEFCKLHFKN